MRWLCLISVLWNNIGYVLYLALSKQLICFVFSLLYGKYFKRFLRYSWKKGRLVLLNVIQTDRPTPLKNAATETPPATVVCVSRAVSVNLITVSNYPILFVHKWPIYQINMPRFQLSFSSDMNLALVVPLGRDLERFYLLCYSI